MMRIETISGVLYYGDVYFGTEFVRIIPNRILVFSKEANGYMELENFPKELFIPITRIEVIAEIENETTQSEEKKQKIANLDENEVTTEKDFDI